jgi:DNA-binding NtrC family response regulator
MTKTIEERLARHVRKLQNVIERAVVWCEGKT